MVLSFYIKQMKYNIVKEIKGKRGRAGEIHTKHGVINTPAFIVVGTKATVKSLTPEQINSLGAEAVLANTYHLYLEPGDQLLRDAGGINNFMKIDKPTFTDSGGFQAFSLGAAFNNKASKIADRAEIEEISRNDDESLDKEKNKFAKVTEDGVVFKSIIDGSEHIFTPERSIEIQHNIGADIIFAFDECTSPHASYEYQIEAMDRTHRWAQRSLDYHRENNKNDQALFGIVQGGRYKDLRIKSAEIIGKMDFDGFGIGGSFDKDDIYNAVGWVNDVLPKDKPKHLLGIGEPVDLFGGIANGIDTFDCVAPTRIARNGNLYTNDGKINILNAKFRNDLTKIDEECKCYTCSNFTKAYVSHLFRSKEMLGATLASIHNLYFIVNLVKKIRESILNDSFDGFQEQFLKRYYKN